MDGRRDDWSAASQSCAAVVEEGQMVPMYGTLCGLRCALPVILLDSLGGQAVNSKASDAPPQSGHGLIRCGKFLHARLTAWLLHVLVSILSSGGQQGGD
jgi:hypothetical protein